MRVGLRCYCDEKVCAVAWNNSSTERDRVEKVCALGEMLCSCDEKVCALAWKNSNTERDRVFLRREGVRLGFFSSEV